MKLRFKVQKLIRDRLPQMMRDQGLAVFERRLDADDFRTALRAKLREEAAEAAEAEGHEALTAELADLLEVVHALVAAEGLSLEEIEAVRLAKRAERGGFDGRIYNEAVEGEASLPAVAYYLARPAAYPQEA